MADTNQTLTNVLASILGGVVGGVAGGVVAARINRRVHDIETQLVPLFGKGRYYTVVFSGGRIMWLDDLCYMALLPSVREVRELKGGGYKFVFPDNATAYLRPTSLVAPHQVGRLLEVRGVEAVGAVRERCAILVKNEEVEEVAVRMVGTTVGEYYERQVDELTGRRGGRR